MGWQPVESAPKGVDILLMLEQGYQIVASWEEDTGNKDFPWVTLDGPSYHRDAPTHWHPLPIPPRTAK